MKFYIVENSLLALIAKKVMKSKNIALVLGKGIHLSGVTREEFLKNSRWVKHEQIHLDQYRKYGVLKFLWLYAWESIRKGYYNNRFEKEAREGAEK